MSNFAPPLAETSEWQTRVHLAAAYRGLALAGVNDHTYNHLAARLWDAPQQVLIKPEHQQFHEVTASSLLKYTLDGEKLSGEGNVSRGGLVIHLGVLKGRPDLQATFHTHTPANIAVSAQRFGLLNLNQHAVRFHRRIGYHDFKGFEFDEAGRQGLLTALGTGRIAILRNHGVLVGGRTIAEAYIHHHFLETACRAQIQALGAGLDNLLQIPDDIAEHSAQQIERKPAITEQHHDWHALLRQVDAASSGYRH